MFINQGRAGSRRLAEGEAIDWQREGEAIVWQREGEADGQCWEGDVDDGEKKRQTNPIIFYEPKDEVWDSYIFWVHDKLY